MRVRILIIAAAFQATTGVHTMAQVAPRPAPTASKQQATSLVPGTRGTIVTTIQGSALTSRNGALAHVKIRLRNAGVGRVVDTTITDEVGSFTFHPGDPGTYIVEIMGDDRTVLAASELINVNAGDVITTVVKLPLQSPRGAGVLGNRASAVAITAAAAAAGILATTVSGTPVSGRPLR